jgi:hypothetical protein
MTFAVCQTLLEIGRMNGKMADKKPLFGMLLSLIGGLIILIVGVLLSIGMVNQNFLHGAASVFGGLDLTGHGGIFAGVFGIVIIIFGILLYMMPKNKMIFGLVIIIVAILNIIIGYDLLFVGSIVALIGGIVGWYLGK